MKNFLCFVLINIILQNASAAAPVTKGLVQNFAQSQIEQIQKIVHNYLVDNPQVLIEAGQKLQEQEIAKEKNKVAQILANIPKYKNQIFDTKAPGRVVLGNPNGKIIVAEFTQHQCPHCQHTAPVVNKLIKNNPEIQRIIIYWPFFGNDAIYSSKAVLAAQKQNKFEALEQAILAQENFTNKEKTDSIIKSITSIIDNKKLLADMDNKDLERGLKNNFKLAQDLNLIGTPTFIFTNREMTKFSLVPGHTPNFEGDLSRALKEVR